MENQEHNNGTPIQEGYQETEPITNNGKKEFKFTPGFAVLVLGFLWALFELIRAVVYFF